MRTKVLTASLLAVALGLGPAAAQTQGKVEKHNVPIWAPAGLQNSLVILGVLPANLAPRMNKGGVITPLGPDIKITMTRDHDDARRALQRAGVEEPGNQQGRAAVATRDFIKPKFAIPIHCGTIPQLKGTPEEYLQALAQTATNVHVMQPGEKVSF